MYVSNICLYKNHKNVDTLLPVGGFYRSANNSAVSISSFAITASFVATGTTLTVTVTGGVLTPGMILSGGTVASGVEIIQQLTGTPGSTGTYQTDVSQSIGTTATGVQYNSTIDGDQIYVRTA